MLIVVLVIRRRDFVYVVASDCKADGNDVCRRAFRQQLSECSKHCVRCENVIVNGGYGHVDVVYDMMSDSTMSDCVRLWSDTR